MHNIKGFKYKKDILSDIKQYRYGTNWPVVYIIEDGKEAYIGETNSAVKRAKQHFIISGKPGPRILQLCMP